MSLGCSFSLISAKQMIFSFLEILPKTDALPLLVNSYPRRWLWFGLTSIANSLLGCHCYQLMTIFGMLDVFPLYFLRLATGSTQNSLHFEWWLCFYREVFNRAFFLKTFLHRMMSQRSRIVLKQRRGCSLCLCPALHHYSTFALSRCAVTQIKAEMNNTLSLRFLCAGVIIESQCGPNYWSTIRLKFLSIVVYDRMWGKGDERKLRAVECWKRQSSRPFREVFLLI